MDEYEARKYRKTEKSGYKKGIKIGEANGINNTALRMIRSGSFSEAQIIEATGLTLEQLMQVKQLYENVP